MTSQSSSLNVTSLPEMTSSAAPTTRNESVCSRAVCASNKICVEDAESAIGYRCCRKSSCGRPSGMHCNDPGNEYSLRRVPEVRKRRRFRLNERIFFYCNNQRGAYELLCVANGHWKMKPETNPCIETPTEPTISGSIPTVQEPQSDVLNIIIIAIGSLLLIFIILIIARYIYNQSDRKRYVKSDEKWIETTQPAPMPDLMTNSIAIDDFQSYVTQRHHGNDFLFLQEFQAIQNESASSQFTTEASNLLENCDKNRYNNIVAYDHTRVHLKEAKRQNSPCDYVNANYVSSFTNQQGFIACQGPLPSTFSDFWEMIWNNNVSVIIMITNLIENGRRKCDRYWPRDGKEVYKHITVSIKQTQVFANYTIRTFIIKNNKLSKRTKAGGERKLVQYHYTEWPDHGTPDYILPVLSFIKQSSKDEQTAPIVVHCR